MENNMESNDMNDSFVDRQMQSLDPPANWQPDGGRALFELRRRDHVRRTRTGWTLAGIAASVAGVGLLLLMPTPCSGANCKQTPGAGAVANVPPAVVAPQMAAPTLAAPAPAPAPTPMPALTAKPVQRAVIVAAAKPDSDFQQSGNPHAPLTVEIYSDYQCPHCAIVFIQMLPFLISDYVETGKVKLIHRDLPLPMHQYARLAARYANAAGTLGQYDAAMAQIYRTQAVWSANGDVDSQVAAVIPPDLMAKVRALVQSDEHLDDRVAASTALARDDRIAMTPSLVVVHDGKRQVLAPIPQYDLLKSYLDGLLK
jgi:protein-disulfide isomerase